MYIVTMVFELSGAVMGEELIGTTESGNEALGMISGHDIKEFIRKEYDREIYLGYRHPEVVGDGFHIYSDTLHYSVADSDEGGTVIYSIWKV